MTEVSTDLEPIGHAVIWCAKAGDRWQAQPYLWPLPAAQALAQRLVVEFGGEAFIAPIAPPSRCVTVIRYPAREVSTDLEPNP